MLKLIDASQNDVLPEGAELGPFRIVQEIARGGMGGVYLAYRRGIAGFVQPCAIKVIHPHMAKSHAFVEMFIDEARIASSINHPNVCRVLDFGKVENTYYLAMEYLAGETLARACRAISSHPQIARIRAEVVAHVIAQACEGLHAAHSALDHTGSALGIVHRDVAPQNVMIGYDGSVRVLDFGIARARDRLHSTRVGTTKGRFPYMSPEHVSGRALDGRSDVWSLGVVLREALTGQTVFKRKNDAETVYAVVHGDMPAWPKAVDPALQAIADRAIQRDVDERYASAREMGIALRRYLVSRDRVVGLAEMAGCMERLFPADAERKRALLCRRLEPRMRLLSQGKDRDQTLKEAHGSKERTLARAPFQDPEDVERLEFDEPTGRFRWDPRPVEALRRDLLRPVRSSVRPSPRHGAREPERQALRPASGLSLLGFGGAAALLTFALLVLPLQWGPAPRIEARQKREEVNSSMSSETVAARLLPSPRMTSAPMMSALDDGPPLRLRAVLPDPPPALETAAAVDLATVRASNASPRAVPQARASQRRFPEPRGAGVPPSPVLHPLGPTPARRAVNGVGTLSVASGEAWADVYEGAKKLGSTPIQLKVPEGTHVITLRGGSLAEVITRTVVVRPDEVTKLRL